MRLRLDSGLQRIPGLAAPQTAERAGNSTGERRKREMGGGE